VISLSALRRDFSNWSIRASAHIRLYVCMILIKGGKGGKGGDDDYGKGGMGNGGKGT
jgi:hypothetical protein